MKLAEIMESDDEDMKTLQIVADTRDWISRMGIADAKIMGPDNSIVTMKDVDLGFKGFQGKIPYKFTSTGHFCVGPNPQLTSFENFPMYSKSIDISNTDITSLVGIEKVVESTLAIHLENTKITEGGIGLLLIKGLQDIDFSLGHEAQVKAFEIIKKYIRAGQAKNHLFDCQADLIDAGLEEFAVL